ncbi:MAG: D-alanyl-D-alanine carboxypeptidase/D-alanyl-D-alanine endopeptidase, partial [Geminicoccaceae bacterium]
ITERNADQHHIPASSAKLATAVVALQRLGPDHRFKTELRITGPIEDGVLKGDLILKGGGDPVLDLPDLLPLIDALARQPVRQIDGRFLIDDTALPRFTEIEPTQPTEAAYNPGVSALSVAFNRVNLRWRKRGVLAVETVPHLEEASFVSTKSDHLPPSGVQLKTLDGRDAIWQLADKGARRSKRSLPVKDAGLFAGQTFRDLATLYGIDLPAPERLDRAQKSRLLAVHESRPLRELVRDMLWYSNNLVAELIGLATAKTLDPDVDRLDGSAGLVLSELERQLSDLSWDDAHLHNHSGLSSRSRLTPEQLAAILRLGWDNGTLSGLLPGSGWSGTLARRFNGPDHALRVWAKTGSINYVTALGGYLMSSSHGPAAFVIMISDEKARAGYDAQPRRTRAIEKKARAWKDQAERAMNGIIERWLEQPVSEPAEDLYASTIDVSAP